MRKNRLTERSLNYSWWELDETKKMSLKDMQDKHLILDMVDSNGDNYYISHIRQVVLQLH